MRRFWDKVQKAGLDECWLWTGALLHDNYGAFRFEGRMQGAHRVAYMLEIGPIAEGMFICHTCDNERCVNPTHLFQGTQSDNVLDSVAKGRYASHRKLTSSQVLAIRAEHNPGENVGYRTLATRYGVGSTTIQRIIQRELYEDV